MNDKFVLLVEDNPDDITLTQFAFRRANVSNKVMVAKDGKEALDFFSRDGGTGNLDHKLGLVLLDLKLPIVSGLDVLKEIKSNKYTALIPVIVLTSSIEDSDQTESLRLGANDYIRKPTGLSEFIEIVKQIKAKWLDSNI